MTDTARAQPNNARRFWFLVLGVLILIAAIAYGVYWLLYARYFESTDDAYVGGNVVTITSKENATVLALHADNTQTVKQGQLLIEMDPTVATVNLQAAEAHLALTVRSVRAQFSKSDAGSAQVNQARVALAQAQDDYARRQKAYATQSVSGEELAHARDAVASAQAALNTASGGLQQTNATIEGADIAHNPDVLAAEAQLRSAAIVAGHMRIIAPLDGVVAQRTVQAGQQVAAGTPLMAVVPLSDVWIDANFKEVQLARMRVGQPVTVKADIYGGSVTYHGHIEGLGAGSGSAFALLPPQNASGNWIKIVQRVPVRIALDHQELADHPLRVGLSVTTDVDVRDESGPLVTTSVGPGVTRANTGEDSGPVADALIAGILRENGADVREAARNVH
ncbi:MAG TPA: HlyD family efflux transporter periplasmic adaptor subunit [Rhizomicrobium sp.]|nr:HlyD family efflux transporter periplasmic adaptor subunit [Rhizomicrobium sp.]